MDELLKDFLSDTAEQSRALAELLRGLDRDRPDPRVVDSVFRLTRRIVGSCGFLDLPRLEPLARAAEAFTGRLRESEGGNAETAKLLAATVDRINCILNGLEQGRREPFGEDSELIARLQSNLPPPADNPTFGRERRAEHARVPFETIDRLGVLAKELTLAREQIEARAGARGAERLREPLGSLADIANALRAKANFNALLPISRLFPALARFARARATELGAEVELTFEGGAIRVDRVGTESLRETIEDIIGDVIARHAGQAETAMIAVRVVGAENTPTVEIADTGAGDEATPRRISPFSAYPTLARLSGVAFSPADDRVATPDRQEGLERARARLATIGGAIDRIDSCVGVRVSLRAPFDMPDRVAISLERGAQVGGFLVVEPTAAIADMLVSTLTRAGLTAAAVRDLERASSEMRAGRAFHAIFVDADLATLGGPEFARRARASGRSTLALIGLAAHGGSISQARARASSLDRAIGKFDRAALVANARAAIAAAAVEMAA